MKGWGIAERDAYDVYYHGSIIKPNMMVRKYNGYEIGIWFFADRVTGKVIQHRSQDRANCRLQQEKRHSRLWLVLVFSLA